jgi:hypothetical protein
MNIKPILRELKFIIGSTNNSNGIKTFLNNNIFQFFKKEIPFYVRETKEAESFIIARYSK